MAEKTGTLEQIAEGLANALSQLTDMAQPANLAMLLNELGIDNPPSLSGDIQLAQSLRDVVTHAAELAPCVEELIVAAEEGETLEIVAAGAKVLAQCSAVGIALDAVGTRLQTALAATPGGPQLAVEFAKRLMGNAIAQYFDMEYPLLRRVLTLATVLDWDVIIPDPDGPVTVIRSRLHLERLLKLLSDPLELLESGYGWGRNDFNASLLLQRISELFEPLEPIATFGDVDGPPVPPILDFGVFTLAPAATAPPGLAGELFFEVAANIVLTLGQLSDDWAVLLRLDGKFGEGLTLELVPPTKLEITPPSISALDGRVALELLGQAPDSTHPIMILGITGASRLETKLVSVSLASNFHWNAGLGRAEGDFGFEGQIQGGKLRIGMDKADGFLAELLSGLSLEADFDVGFGWTAGGGFYFTGSSALEIQLPVHIDLGPLDVTAITLVIGVEANGLSIGFSTNIKALLGPITAVVEQIGMSAEMSFPPNHPLGNLGLLDLTFGFKPPNGVGLSLDAGVVKGGGYLYFDFDREEYAGVLELSIAEIVTVKAIGLITTKMPDGSKGFSLLIIITAEFGAGFQLGFGFTLVGLGGLLGLNRTMNLQPLMEGVRTGAINSIMFPQNPVANAPRIISDLRTIFPAYVGIFLIGPMAKLGWGTPTLISVALGVIIEIPGNIAILGVLKVALPAEEAALIIIQVNFAGAIEFDKKRLYFFAALFESRVLFLTIEGEMGLLVAWGTDANFVVSVGGFHPRFNPPPLPFPSPKRIALDILHTPVYRIRAEGYFAVTTNTAQFGANTELVFDIGVARIEGHIVFDALFQFSPFYFIIEISAGVSFKVFGIGLYSISLHFALEGPTPWRAHGTGTLSLFFFDVSADFDVTWGESQDTTLPPLPVMPLLRAELEKLDNWTAELPVGINLLVSLRQLPATETAQVLHPLGMLRVSQRAVPFDLKIDKVGNQQPSDANEFTCTPTAGLVKVDDSDEQFAKAQFINMSDADKLSQRAFDPLHGGVLLSSGAQQLGAARLTKRRVRYEQIIIDNNYKRFRKRFFRFTLDFFNHFLNGAAITKSPLSQQAKTHLDPFKEKVTVKPGGFTVAFTENNTAYSSQSTYFASEATAAQFIREQAALNPELQEVLHVIPQHEANL